MLQLRQSLLLTIILIYSTITVSYAEAPANSPQENPNYVLVIDAGSSGSRLFIYDGSNNIDLPSAQAKVKPGLSSYADNPQAAAKSLAPLMQLAETTLSKLPHSPTAKPSLLVYATAGMRLLTAEQQQAIYNAIVDASKEYRNFNLQDAKTITGQEEGVFAWVALNQLKGKFTDSLKSTATVGSIELGGASLQVVYELPVNADRSNYNPDDLTTITIAGHSYELFAKSYLGLGQNQTAKAIDAQAGCLPQGYQNNYEFNAKSCQAALDNHIANITATQGAMPPLPKQTAFVAFGGFGHMQDFYTITNSGSLLPMIEGGLCRQSWQALKEHYDQIAEPYLAYYCMNGVYASSLYTNLLHLASNNHQTTIENKVNGKPISWTLGTALLF